LDKSRTGRRGSQNGKARIAIRLRMRSLVTRLPTRRESLNLCFGIRSENAPSFLPQAWRRPPLTPSVLLGLQGYAPQLEIEKSLPAQFDERGPRPFDLSREAVLNPTTTPITLIADLLLSIYHLRGNMDAF